MALNGYWFLFNLSEGRGSDALDWGRLQSAARSSKASKSGPAKQQLTGIRSAFDALRTHHLRFSDDQIALNARSGAESRDRFLRWLCESLDKVPLATLALHADISLEEAKLWHEKVQALAAVRFLTRCAVVNWKHCFCSGNDVVAARSLLVDAHLPIPMSQHAEI